MSSAIESIQVNRRSFLRSSGALAGGLLLGFHLPGRGQLEAQTAGAALKLNAFIHVGTDDMVTFFIHKSDMGQGTVTSLSMLLAEELECDWKKIKTEFAPVDAAFGRSQGVFGSQSIRTGWTPLRQAGASAREMLVQAAAQQWGVDKSQCRAENNAVINTASNARLSFGSLADAASKLTPPLNVPLKDPKTFRLIGKATKRLDSPDKVNGRAQFGIDVRRPGMLYAVVARCPVFGGKLVSFDGTKAKAVAGVKDVVALSNSVAVVADNTWSAAEGRKVLQVQWDEGANADKSSASLRKMFADMTANPGAEARKVGDAAAALASANRKIDGVYEAPYLSHAPMEPLNCVADVRADSCEIWASTQNQSASRDVAARLSGVPADRVQVHTMFLGGGFGRRAGTDFIAEAVEVSKAMKAPVKVTWTRDDDLQHDFYRPASYCVFGGGVDNEGWPVVWTTRVACPSFNGPRPGVDRTAVEGIADMLYTVPNILVDYHNPPAGIPTTFWRSVGYSQNTFFTESWIDELAVLGRKDPLEVRRRLLEKSPRMLAALNLATEKAGWGRPLAAGRHQGISVVNNIGSFTAQVAEVSVTQGKLKVHRVVCAVDCGHVVNPAGIEQQVRSGIVYGLSAALKGNITLERGRVVETNFHQYDVVRIDETPEVEVYVVPSEANPGGMGEATTPGIAPAVANAIFAATGKRIRRLPIRPADLV